MPAYVSCVLCPCPGSRSWSVSVSRLPIRGPCPCPGSQSWSLSPSRPGAAALRSPGARSRSRLFARLPGPGPGRAVPVPGNPRESPARLAVPGHGPLPAQRDSACSRGQPRTQSRHYLRPQARSSEPRDAQRSQLLALLWAQPGRAPPQSWGLQLLGRGPATHS